MTENKNIKYWIWLSSLVGIDPGKRRKLLEYFRTPENIWNAGVKELMEIPGITRKNYEQLTDENLKKQTGKNLENIKSNKINIITINDDSYPLYLKNTYDPPIVLYVRGTVKKDEKIIAVVGARTASSYGMKTAEKISYELSRCGIAIASGMARGIDSCAHYGALKAGGRTVAVLGCGTDTVYPPENEKLMDKIMQSGAVVSEYLPGVPPLPINFPARNRIISGISVGVVVIEAGERSGSLITADFALEQGREVFALPGNINSPNSAGTNKLIKDGAKIVTGVEDILEELKIYRKVKNKTCKKDILDEYETQYKGLDDEERKIVRCLADEPLHIDLLTHESGLSIQRANSLLVLMELKGIVEQLHGKIYRLRESLF